MQDKIYAEVQIVLSRINDMSFILTEYTISECIDKLECLLKQIHINEMYLQKRYNVLKTASEYIPHNGKLVLNIENTYKGMKEQNYLAIKANYYITALEAIRDSIK